MEDAERMSCVEQCPNYNRREKCVKQSEAIATGEKTLKRKVDRN